MNIIEVFAEQGAPVHGLRGSLQSTTDLLCFHRQIGPEQHRKAWGPMACPPSAKVAENGRKVLLGRVADSTFPGGRLLGPVSPVSTHSSRNPHERVAMVLPEGEPIRSLAGSHSQKLRKIQAQTPWDLITRQDYCGQGPPSISSGSLLCETPVPLAGNPSPFLLPSLTHSLANVCLPSTISPRPLPPGSLS